MGIPLQMSDETILPFSPGEIWPVLADITRYPKWWPRSLFVAPCRRNPGLIGAEYTLRPYGWRSFCCRVVSVEEPALLGLQYQGTYMEGVAEWRLEPVGNGTKVIYAMDAEVHDLAVALVGKVPPIYIQWHHGENLPVNHR